MQPNFHPYGSIAQINNLECNAIRDSGCEITLCRSDSVFNPDYLNKDIAIKGVFGPYVNVPLAST